MRVDDVIKLENIVALANVVKWSDAGIIGQRGNCAVATMTRHHEGTQAPLTAEDTV